MNVKETWNKYLLFWNEADKFYDEANKFYDEVRKLWGETYKLYDERNKFYDEASKLWNEAGKLYDEANKLLSNIIEYYGDIKHKHINDKIVLDSGVILYYNGDIYFPLKVIMKEILKKGKE